MNDAKQIRTCHLFAGHGGGLLADKILGHTPVVAVEWDRYACKVLRERAADGWFPGLQVWEGDVRLFDPSEYTGVVDIIHAGFPCQDISVAGKQAGVSEGTRSGLYREVLRIAGVVRPKGIFLENVSAILGNGLGTVLGDLASLGYDSKWLCIRASDIGANHHRDRWFLLAHTNDRWLQRGRSSKDVGANVQIRGGIQANGAQNIGSKKAKILADTDSAQRKGNECSKRIEQKYTDVSSASWWEVEPELGRVDDGVPNLVEQLKGYGNAQVPLQAAVAYRLLGGI